jgi:hypothetical protein
MGAAAPKTNKIIIVIIIIIIIIIKKGSDYCWFVHLINCNHFTSYLIQLYSLNFVIRS